MFWSHWVGIWRYRHSHTSDNPHIVAFSSIIYFRGYCHLENRMTNLFILPGARPETWTQQKKKEIHMDENQEVLFLYTPQPPPLFSPAFFLTPYPWRPTFYILLFIKSDSRPLILLGSTTLYRSCFPCGVIFLFLFFSLLFPLMLCQYGWWEEGLQTYAQSEAALLPLTICSFIGFCFFLPGHIPPLLRFNSCLLLFFSPFSSSSPSSDGDFCLHILF